MTNIRTATWSKVGKSVEIEPDEIWTPDRIGIEVPGGRYWEPGVEENPPLPREKWLDVEPEDLPFK